MLNEMQFLQLNRSQNSTALPAVGHWIMSEKGHFSP